MSFTHQVIRCFNRHQYSHLLQQIPITRGAREICVGWTTRKYHHHHWLHSTRRFHFLSSYETKRYYSLNRSNRRANNIPVISAHITTSSTIREKGESSSNFTKSFSSDSNSHSDTSFETSGTAKIPPKSSSSTTTKLEVPIKVVVGVVLRHIWPANQPKLRIAVIGAIGCVLTGKCLRVLAPFWFKSIIDTLHLVVPSGLQTGEQGDTVANTSLFLMQNSVHVVDLGIGGVITCTLLTMIVAYGLSRLISSFTEELKTVLFAPVGAFASTTMQIELFRKLHSLDSSFHIERRLGNLMKDLDRGGRSFWPLTYAILFTLIPTVLEMGFVCLALQYQQAGGPFVSIALSAVVAYVFWTYLLSQRRAVYRAEYNRTESRVNGVVMDSLLNHDLVRILNKASSEVQLVEGETIRMNRELIKLDRSMAILNLGQQLIFISAAVLSLYCSISSVLIGKMTIGELVLVDTLLMQLYTPLSFLGILYREIQTSTQNMQSMISLLDLQPTIVDSPNAKAYISHGGKLEFRHINYISGHSSHRRTILRNISFTIPPGSFVAFVGPSGSGKSTILRLICRFIDPSSGKILLDDQSLSGLQLSSFRPHIGLIPQDPILFHDTIYTNIKYGRTEATRDEVLQAAQLAMLNPTLKYLEDGIQTMVGERGTKLSGGERQRVAIARVLLQDADILLADEATSALDTKMETLVMKALRGSVPSHHPSPKPSRSRTLIVVAHRLTTIVEADIIFVLSAYGELVQQGTHQELLATPGIYHSLWVEQKRQVKSGKQDYEQE